MKLLFSRCMPLTAGCVLCALPSSSQSRTTSSLHSHRQPRCRRCACHQLPCLPVAHQPGRKAASARGQVHCLQWSYSKWRLHHHSCRQTKTVTVQHSTFLSSVSVTAWIPCWILLSGIFLHERMFDWLSVPTFGLLFPHLCFFACVYHLNWCWHSTKLIWA